MGFFSSPTRDIYALFLYLGPTTTTTEAPTTLAPCPPEQISVNDYIQAGAYYFYQTTNEVTGDNAEDECTVLDLTWVDVNSAEQVQRLMQADLGEYIGAGAISTISSNYVKFR